MVQYCSANFFFVNLSVTRKQQGRKKRYGETEDMYRRKVRKAAPVERWVSRVELQNWLNGYNDFFSRIGL